MQKEPTGLHKDQAIFHDLFMQPGELYSASYFSKHHEHFGFLRSTNATQTRARISNPSCDRELM